VTTHLAGLACEIADEVLFPAALDIDAGGEIPEGHWRALAALSASPNTALRDDLMPALVAGRTKRGVAFAGPVPVPPRMRAERVDGGWRLSGHAPFFSRVTRADFMATQNFGSRLNGTLPIGAGRRC
jgi:alkylation response protein AidB-like acyl-CoA dehydrogenase